MSEEAAVLAETRPAPPDPAVRRGGQYQTIQALRFLAAFAVVVLHASFYTAERLDASLSVWVQGGYGVRLFFVISGFVMILTHDETNTSPRSWSDFAIKRIVRIVPMYWAASLFKLATLMVAASVVLHARVDWAYVLQSFFFVPAYNVDGHIRPLLGVGWTLTFEMFFYALFTIALLVRMRPITFLAPFLIVLAALSVFRTPHWPVALQCWADPIVLDFLAGMLLAEAGRKGYGLPPGAAFPALLLGLAYLFLPLAAYTPAYDSIAGSLLTTLASTLAIAGAIALEPRVGVHIPRSVIFMGSASYALYLVHPLVAPAVPTLFRKFGLMWPYPSIVLAIAVAMVAGAACHLLIEKPMTRLLTKAAKARGLLTTRAPSAAQVQ